METKKSLAIFLFIINLFFFFWMDRARLRKLFKVFATLSAFISLKQQDSRSIRYNSIKQLGVSHKDLAIFSGVLGGSILQLMWLTEEEIEQDISYCLAADTEYELCYILDPTKSNNTKRRRIDKTAAQTVAGLVELFDRNLDSLETPFEELVQQHLPANPMSQTPNASPIPITKLLDELKDSPFYHSQIIDVATKILPSAKPQFKDLDNVRQEVWEAVSRWKPGFSQLYLHQAQSIQYILDGHDVVTSTATASGKSLIYQLPILQHLLADPEARILILFPTKALAQDQLSTLRELVNSTDQLSGDTLVCTYDGDSDSKDRRKIRERARVVLTNPDSLHTAMLPNHTGWRQFWMHLKMVVIDELHVYQGQFGQHLSCILARLQRFCHGLQFVASSATTSNPQEHLQQLIHRTPVKSVAVDGSSHGERHMVLWDRHKSNDMPQIASHLLSGGLRTIVFCKTRQQCELTYRDIIDKLDTTPHLRSLKPLVMSYRGGYSASERREIERDMFEGHTRMVVATSALELGIDIGSLDVVVMLGVPYSSASLWQQAGRAGRQRNSSLAMVVATGHATDRMAVNTPEDLFKREFAPAHISFEPSITMSHLQCAAFERPISLAEDSKFLEQLGIKDPSTYMGEPWLQWDSIHGKFTCALHFKPWPSANVSIRSGQQQQDNEWYVMLGGRLLETLSTLRAVFTIYEGGIFLHRGQTYSVDQVDSDSRVALVSLAHVSWYTESRDFKDVRPQKAIQTSRDLPVAHYGEMEIFARTIGYKRIDSQTKKVVEMVDHLSPAITLTTKGIWIQVSKEIAQELANKDLDVEASIHGAQHLVMWAISRTVGCTMDELGTECKSPLATRPKVPRLVVYEQQPVRGGPTQRCLSSIKRILELAATGDVYLQSCTEQNQCLSQPGALLILQRITQKHTSL